MKLYARRWDSIKGRYDLEPLDTDAVVFADGATGNRVRFDIDNRGRIRATAVGISVASNQLIVIPQVANQILLDVSGD